MSGSYTNHLQLAPDRQPRQNLITQSFTGRLLFLTPNQQRQNTEVSQIQAVRNSWLYLYSPSLHLTIFARAQF